MSEQLAARPTVASLKRTDNQASHTQASDGQRTLPSPMADPVPVALGLFALALFLFGVRYVQVDAATLSSGPITVGLDYALLITGIAQILGGVLAIVRGMAYPAYITVIFGFWLVGFYLLVTSGVEKKAFTPEAVAWYCLALVIPVAILAVPAFVHRQVPYMITFVSILGILILVGIGFHAVHNAIDTATRTKTAPDFSGPVRLLKASAWCAFAAAATIWFAFAHNVFRATGVLRAAVGSRVGD